MYRYGHSFYVNSVLCDRHIFMFYFHILITVWNEYLNIHPRLMMKILLVPYYYMDVIISEISLNFGKLYKNGMATLSTAFCLRPVRPG